MTQQARELIAAFDALAPAEKQQVAVEILRRSASDEELNAQMFDDVAVELFLSYDAEESRSAER